MVADAITTDAGQALAERTDDEIRIGFDSGCGCGPPAIVTHDTQGMRLIDHQAGAVLALDCRDLRQRCNIAKHAIDALNDNECFLGAFPEPAQALFQVGGVVMAETNYLCTTESNAVINARVRIRIEKNHFTRPGQGCAHPHGRGISC